MKEEQNLTEDRQEVMRSTNWGKEYMAGRKGDVGRTTAAHHRKKMTANFNCHLIKL